jgi:predicted nucleic acid-binding protein
MSRVYWDAMMLIYLLEEDPLFAEPVRMALARSKKREDTLLTSYLSLAEALVGTEPGSLEAETLRNAIPGMGFTFVAFNGDAVEPFRRLRSDFGLRPPDSMHLACAAAARTDLFLTNDSQLLKRQLQVPGIQFIASFINPPL